MLRTFALVAVIFALSGCDQAPAPPELNTPANLRAAAKLVEAHGFDCMLATEVRGAIWRGTNVECDGWAGKQYHYRVEDQGGRWHVTFRY